MHGTLLLAASALALSPPADEAKNALLADDLRFAENLARHRYFDLSFDVIQDTQSAIEKAGDDALAGEANLIEARIYKRQAENSVSMESRAAAQTAAVERLRDWSRPGSPFAFHDRRVDALQDLAEALRNRGSDNAREYREGGDTEARDAAEKDFREAEDVYEDLEREATSRADQLEGMEQGDAAEVMRNQALNTLFLRGINAIEWAEVSADPKFRLEEAIEHFDDFQWDASDEQLIFYSAMFHQARGHARLAEVLEKSGAPDDLAQAEDERANAAEILDYILEVGGPAYWEPVEQFPTTAQRLISDLFAATWGALAQLEASTGDLDVAQGWIDTLIGEHDKKGLAIGRAGHDVLLDWSGKLDELGRRSQATEIVKRVAEEGLGTPQGARAEALLADLVAGGPVESPDVLMSVARGLASQQSWADAAFNFQRAAATVRNEDERRRFSFQAWMGAGDAFSQLKRSLEAALAYEQALEAAQEFDASADDVERAASRMYNAYNRRFTGTQDAFDKSLRDQASERLISMGIAKDLQFINARETFAEVADGDAQGFLAAQHEFEVVPESSTNYERALVYIGRCLRGAGRLEEALDKFAEVQRRADDPALQPTSAEGRTRREVALAEARYYHAELLLSDELQRPAEALQILDGFEEDLPGQPSFHTLAKYRRVQAYAMRGDVDEAEEALDLLIDSGSDASLVFGAAYKVAVALEDASRAQRDAGAEAEAASLLTRAADAMWLYAEKSGYKNFANLLTTGEWYLEAGEPESAQRVFDKVLEVFSKSEVSDASLDRARTGLATAFDRQRDFGRSRPLWTDLVERNPQSTTIRSGAARSFGGWLERNGDGSVAEVAGSGDYTKAFELWADLQKRTSVTSKYHGVWWEAKLGTIYTLYRQAEVTPESARQARRVMDNLKLSQPNYDRDTVQGLDEEYRYDDLYEPYFKYLDRQLPAQ